MFVSLGGTDGRPGRRSHRGLRTGARAEADPAPPEPEVEADPASPEPASIEPDVDLIDGSVEPSRTGSGGEYVGNEIGVPTANTRSGRRSRPPAYLNDYCP